MSSRFFVPTGCVIAIAALLQGCAFSGLDGDSKYACKAPEGVRCDSLSGNYYNAIQNNLPSQRRSREPAEHESQNWPRAFVRDSAQLTRPRFPPTRAS